MYNKRKYRKLFSDLTKNERKYNRFNLSNNLSITHLHIECALAIIQAGIKEVYYREKYRDLNGVKFLKKNNIKVYQLKETKANE